uniref:Uncharacterized protein n=1 Tax=Glossina austeni TaxID=7395 RepID=A0A1A9VCY6_GLOAU
MLRDCGKFVGRRFTFIPTPFRQSTVRCSSRKDCLQVIRPRCDVKDPDICKGKELKLDQRLYLTKPKGTIWEYPFCCANFCADLSVRTDELYYKKSDMRSRDYQQTWISCPPLHVLDAEVCPPQNCNPREIIRRKRRIRLQDKKEERPKVACPQKLKKFKLMACISTVPEENRLCPKIPGEFSSCVTVRLKTLCKVYTKHAVCKKDPAPYPSFSECQREVSTPRPIECKCLERAAACEGWEKFRQRLAWKRAAAGD